MRLLARGAAAAPAPLSPTDRLLRLARLRGLEAEAEAEALTAALAASEPI